MNRSRTFYWVGYYMAVATLAALVGLACIAGGVVLGLNDALALYYNGASTSEVLDTALPGLVLALVGVLLWKFIAAFGFYRTMTGAVEEEMQERFDSERVKSEILSVLDDRLSDVQHEIERVNKGVNELNRDEASQDFGFDE